MIAMIRTYSAVDWPLRRRVLLGDTPPRKEFPLRAYAAPLAKGNAIPPLAYEQEGYSDRLYRSGNAVAAYTPTRLSAYLATELHHYTPTPLQSYTQSIQQGNQQNKGVPETAPRRKASCYYCSYQQDLKSSLHPSSFSYYYSYFFLFSLIERLGDHGFTQQLQQDKVTPTSNFPLLCTPFGGILISDNKTRV